mgnify:CR=1 FL=1
MGAQGQEDWFDEVMPGLDAVRPGGKRRFPWPGRHGKDDGDEAEARTRPRIGVRVGVATVIVTGLMVGAGLTAGMVSANRRERLADALAACERSARAWSAGSAEWGRDRDRIMGSVDLDALRAAVGPDTAGLMLTNPNTVGIFDKNILEITKIIHDAGGLCYYDGANLNAVMGVVRPGDMGFDCIHSNLHKTFATPHGGGGPGAGAVGCKEFLKKYMPGPLVVKKDGKYGFASPEKSIGRVKMFYGNFDVVVRALTYVLTLGKSGIREAAMNAVLNANYMRVRLKDTFTMAYDEICMHEFVMSLVDLHKETGVSALDLAKGMLDFGLHPPTMYFPLIVHEALMIEPCETESKETMDEVCGIYCKLFELAHSDPETLHTAPHSTPVRRLDEVGAARNMVLRYQFA